MLSIFTVLKVVGIAVITILSVAAALLVTIVWFLTMRRFAPARGHGRRPARSSAGVRGRLI
jgi:hypothetical protein